MSCAAPAQAAATNPHCFVCCLRSIMMSDDRMATPLPLIPAWRLKEVAPRMNRFPFSRREFLTRSGMGMGALALASLLDGTARLSAATDGDHPLSPRGPHFPAKAKQVVHLFMNGGPSHLDTFDPKPMLKKYHGKALPGPSLRTERKTGAALGSPFEFKRYGASGIEVSELFARTAQSHVDDLCIIRSMYADVPN